MKKAHLSHAQWIVNHAEQYLLELTGEKYTVHYMLTPHQDRLLPVDKVLEITAHALELYPEDYPNPSRASPYLDLRRIGLLMIAEYSKATDYHMSSVYGLDRSTIITCRQGARDLITTHDARLYPKYIAAKTAIDQWITPQSK